MTRLMNRAYVLFVLVISANCQDYAESDLSIYSPEDNTIYPELVDQVNENTINADFIYSQSDDPEGYHPCGPASDVADECPPLPPMAVIIEQDGQEPLKWLSEKVKFYVTPQQFSAREVSLLAKAMGTIQRRSCVRFQQVKGHERDIVIIQKNGPICAADVGRRFYDNNHQRLMLGKICFMNGYGPVLHELMHILGFYHEHMRTDRDEYIQVLRSNINSKFRHNFEKAAEGTIDLLGQPYDMGSIMHYGAGDFAIRKGLKTIKAIGGYSGMIGQRNGLSTLDIRKLNIAYRCGGSRSLSAQPNFAPSLGDYEEEEEFFIDMYDKEPYLGGVN